MRLFIVLLFSTQVVAQPLGSWQESRLGVVWAAPESVILATADLEDMRAAGIRVVRTGSVRDPTILSMADSLGILLFRELPLSHYPAGKLLDSTLYAGNLLNELIRAGQGFASAGPIGLATNADVSDPDACAFFSEVRQGMRVPDDQEFYYVSSFIESDVCAETVDFVLIDARDHLDPVKLITRWSQLSATRAGLAAVGWWLDSGSSGLGASHSMEEQARALERSLVDLDEWARPTVAFVHRWRDQARHGIAEESIWDVYGRRYGLRDSNRRPRPAFDVLSAYLTTGQNVFAFPAATKPAISLPWFIILGWILIVTVAVLYASSPRFRYMVPRYFIAHGFFRNAVREAREVLPIVSTALLTAMGLAVGLIGTQVFLTLHDTAPVKHLVGLQSIQTQSVLVAMLTDPVLSVFLLGSVALLAVSAWMGVWMIIASRKIPLLPSQALMLGVWPRWQLLLLLPMAMSIHTLPPETALFWIGVLLPLWIGTAFWASIRTTYDLMKITNCSPAVAAIVWLLNPVCVIILAVLALLIVERDQAVYLWHLATRG